MCRDCIEKCLFLLSCDPHHDILIQHIFWHTVRRSFWKSIWHMFWCSIWLIFWHSLCMVCNGAFYPACLLTYSLTFYLACFLPYFELFLTFFSGRITFWHSSYPGSTLTYFDMCLGPARGQAALLKSGGLHKLHTNTTYYSAYFVSQYQFAGCDFIHVHNI